MLLPQGLFGIIGRPLGHSLSPLTHNLGFSLGGLPNVYLRWELSDDQLPAFMGAVRTLPVSGVSVTIPFKQAVPTHVDRVTQTAQNIGAVNTLFWEGEKLIGDNTDAEGFLRPLRGAGFVPRRALVLGAGGAARAVCAGLAAYGVNEVTVSARDPEKAKALAATFALIPLPWQDRAGWDGDLVVNTTPLGMASRFAGECPWPEQTFPRSVSAVYDLVYNPLRTPFLDRAASREVTVFNGLEMFLGQADLQFQRWTGRSLPMEKVRAACLNVLQGR